MTVMAPVGKVDSLLQVLAPDAAIGAVTTVASNGLARSPTAVASQSVVVGHAIVPIWSTVPGRASSVTVGVQAGLKLSVPGSPSRRSTPGAPVVVA